MNPFFFSPSIPLFKRLTKQNAFLFKKSLAMGWLVYIVETINTKSTTQNTMYTIHCQYDDNGTLVTETTTTNSRREALRLCEQELKWENTISAFATDSAGDLVE